MMDSCHYMFVKTHRWYNTKSEPCVDCGLWVVRIRQCRHCNQCTPLWGPVDSGGDPACVGQWGHGTSCTFCSLLLLCDPKTALKIRPFFFFFCFLGPYPWHMELPRLGNHIGATASGLHHSHSNTGSKLHLQPTPQLAATPDP